MTASTSSDEARSVPIAIDVEDDRPVDLPRSEEVSVQRVRDAVLGRGRFVV